MALKIPKNKTEFEQFKDRQKKRSEKELRVTWRNLHGIESASGVDRAGLIDGIIGKVEKLMTEEGSVPKASKKPGSNRGRKKGGDTIRALVVTILSNKPDIDTQNLIDQVKEKFPDSAFNQNHAAWYRNKFKKGDLS